MVWCRGRYLEVDPGSQAMRTKINRNQCQMMETGEMSVVETRQMSVAEQERCLPVRQDRCLLLAWGAPPPVLIFYTSFISQQKTCALRQEQTCVLSKQ